MLAGNGHSTRFIYNGVTRHYFIETVLITDPVPKRKLIKGRVRQIGWIKVVNQFFFQLFAVSLLKRISRKRYRGLLDSLGLDMSELPESKIRRVGFVNSELCICTLKDLKPDIVIVNGTSIISQKVLSCTSAIFINTHVGITPQYRGVHGGYWALRKGDLENFGVTIHRVDRGIDTGDIIYQATTKVRRDDNFVTYPLYQYALAIPLLIRAILDVSNNSLKFHKKDNVESKLYYHPTMTEYLCGWIRDGVK